ncbi:MAG TPA: SUMF1/EgtB/PvdO family nonheme iron enzyme [Prosthecobacter sp.]|nr:SUMF1/EgtB/PvdO family nonheme iron enzyme [Prosthecobacter sp.]
MKVRKNSLTGVLNDVVIVHWEGDLKRFQETGTNPTRDPGFPVVNADDTGVIIHKATIIEFLSQPPPPTALPTGPTSWTDTKGRSITATFKAIASGNVLLDIAGKVTPVPLNTLSAVSQKLARDYQQQTPPAASTKEAPFVNSLGMKFVPVPGTKVLFCVHETRYQDYAAYAKEQRSLHSGWVNQTVVGFEPAERPGEHPVTYVGWDDATAFCAWLSRKEGRSYRLPTDEEWSVAVGIATMENRKQGMLPADIPQLPNVFAWGTTWPPPPGAGNFSDQSRKTKAPHPGANYLPGYDDGFPTTAPVMSFKPNALGIYDLCGNVAEWVEDRWNSGSNDRVMRGSCLNDDRLLHLSNRAPLPTGYRNYNRGFRCVLETAPATDPKGNAASLSAVQPASSPGTVTNPAAATATSITTKDKPFVNTLGMKFVPVPGTKVLFCIHETRRQDFAAHAAAASGVNRSWMDQQENGVACGAESDHPVVGVNWDDASKFCEWLSQREGRRYRLPTDQEWSWAVDIGQQEQSSQVATPETLNGKLATVFPWGSIYPPAVKDVGNYADSTWHEEFLTKFWIENYSDGFPTTAPVMSFKPSKLGLYDLGGNVWEWVQDWWNAEQKERVLRGGSFNNVHHSLLLSSGRLHFKPADRYNNHGFRVVLELPPP